MGFGIEFKLEIRSAVEATYSSSNFGLDQFRRFVTSLLYQMSIWVPAHRCHLFYAVRNIGMHRGLNAMLTGKLIHPSKWPPKIGIVKIAE